MSFWYQTHPRILHCSDWPTSVMGYGLSTGYNLQPGFWSCDAHEKLLVTSWPCFFSPRCLWCTFPTFMNRKPRSCLWQVLKLLQGDSEVTNWARLQVNSSDGTDMLDDEAFPRSNLQSHLNLALLDVQEDSLSMSSIEQSVSFEDYLQGRWSRSSSFD